MKKLPALFLFLLILPMLFSCSSLVKLENQNGNLIDNKNGITYICAPMCFEPISTEIEPYAECKELNLQLYGIIGLDTCLWLSESFEGIGAVYYADKKIVLPSISEFEASGLSICYEAAITSKIAEINNKEKIDAVIDAYLNGQKASVPKSSKAYDLKFTSEKYSGIYYTIFYLQADDGRYYIYDRSSKNCVLVDNVLSEYIGA